MGTKSLTKFLTNAAGVLAEVFAIKTSAGAADADKIPALNAAGVLDKTLLNAKSGSAGAGDADTVVIRGADGRIAMTDMPTGIGADTEQLVASEALTNGCYVNIWDDAGVFKVRKADASVAGKEANGFVSAVVAQGATATVYFEGTNRNVTGQTPGKVYLQVTPGVGAAAVPNANGNVVQLIGFATSATSVNFQFNNPITVAA